MRCAHDVSKISEHGLPGAGCPTGPPQVGLQKQLTEKVVAKKTAKEADKAMVATILEGAKIAQLIDNERVLHEKARPLSRATCSGAVM